MKEETITEKEEKIKRFVTEFFEELFKDRSDKDMTNFAKSIGATLNTAVRVRSANIEAENEFHRSKIMEWRVYMIDSSKFSIEVVNEYDKMFGIEYER